MTVADLETYRDRIWKQIARLQRDASSVSQQAFAPAAGHAAGELSNAPLHLGDVGTEAYLQELNAALLENQEYMVKECLAAARRISEGTFGRCENCGHQISRARLDAIPFVRHCAPCAEVLTSGPSANLNAGRADARLSAAPARLLPGDPNDRYAAGSAGGGTAVGGLAGSNSGNGNPIVVKLDAAAGSGVLDMDEPSTGVRRQAGRAGGAAEPAPAGKRTRHAKNHRAKRLRRR